MKQPFDFIVIALAVWRISNMLVKENGPSHIFERMRYRLGIRRSKDDPESTYAKDPDSFLATLFLCVWCLSLHVGGAFVALWAANHRVARWVTMPLSLSAVACLLDWITGE